MFVYDLIHFILKKKYYMGLTEIQHNEKYTQKLILFHFWDLYLKKNHIYFK